MKVTFILLLLLTFAQAKDMSRWDQDSIVRESWKYIQATKNELKTRAARVKKETGQEVPVAFKYFANMTKEQKKFHDKFLKARASKAQTEAHIKGFLADLEKNRKVVAAAERIAEKIWNEKNTSVKDEAPKNKMIEAKLYGEKIKAEKLGVILDHSGSMTKYLPKLRKEIELKFPNAVFYEIYGSILDHDEHYGRSSENTWIFSKPSEGDNPFLEKWFCPEIPQKYLHYHIGSWSTSNLSAMNSLIKDEKVDTIYWFTDMKDKAYGQGLQVLSNLFEQSQVKLYIHTVGRTPPREVTAVTKKTGGDVIRKRVR